MKSFLAVFKRELRGYFSTPVAYVFLVIFLFFTSYLTFQKGFYDMRQADLRVFFDGMPLLFVFLSSAIAMRLWAEEKRTNSIELLFSLPITTTQAVLGKFFAAWSVIAIALLLTFPMVLTVNYLGNPDNGPILTGYIASLLLAGSYLAIGSFFSGITRNQVIAFVLSVVACAIFLYAASPTTLDYVSSFLPGGFAEALESLSFESHFESMQRGVIELRDLAFFVLMGAGWLVANIILLKERRSA